MDVKCLGRSTKRDFDQNCEGSVVVSQSWKQENIMLHTAQLSYYYDGIRRTAVANITQFETPSFFSKYVLVDVHWPRDWRRR
eukprot:1634461-Amphidinium_carterae.1